jgi:hypothetical protein
MVRYWSHLWGHLEVVTSTEQDLGGSQYTTRYRRATYLLNIDAVYNIIKQLSNIDSR